MDSFSEPFTVLVLCPPRFSRQMAAAMNTAARNHDCRTINFKFIDSLEYVDSVGGTEADFVVVVIDLLVANMGIECRHLLLKLTPSFSNTRMILLNGCCRSSSLATTKELIEIADHFQVLYANSEINDPETCNATAGKIVKLALTVCGCETGVPVIVPKVDDFFPA